MGWIIGIFLFLSSILVFLKIGQPLEEWTFGLTIEPWYGMIDYTFPLHYFIDKEKVMNWKEYRREQLSDFWLKFVVTIVISGTLTFIKIVFLFHQLDRFLLVYTVILMVLFLITLITHIVKGTKSNKEQILYLALFTLFLIPFFYSMGWYRPDGLETIASGLEGLSLFDRLQFFGTAIYEGYGFFLGFMIFQLLGLSFIPIGSLLYIHSFIGFRIKKIQESVLYTGNMVKITLIAYLITSGTVFAVIVTVISWLTGIFSALF